MAISEITHIICYIIGLVSGAWLIVIGYKLGFKASYQIRETISGEEQPDKLLTNRTDPAEFGLLEPEEPE